MALLLWPTKHSNLLICDSLRPCATASITDARLLDLPASLTQIPVETEKLTVLRITRLAYRGVGVKMISRRALEDAMTVAAREHELISSNKPPSRNQVLARYRQLREIGRRHHHETLGLVAADALLHRRAICAWPMERPLLLEHMNELCYAYDLAIYTAPPGTCRRSIVMHARSARFAAGSDEAVVLTAMHGS